MYKYNLSAGPINDNKVDHVYPEYHSKTIFSMKHVCAESNQAPCHDTVDKASFMVRLSMKIVSSHTAVRFISSTPCGMHPMLHAIIFLDAACA